MQESEKNKLLKTLQSEIEHIIEEKRRNTKFDDKLKNLNVKVNLGLQIDTNSFYWLNLIADNNKYELSREKLSSYDLELKITPEDLISFFNGTSSIIQILTKKNQYGNNKLIIGKGTSGRNLLKLLKLLKILTTKKFVMHKIRYERSNEELNLESKETPLIKKKYKLMIATIIGIFLPIFLTFLFMVSLDQITLYLNQVNGNIGVLFSMVVFNSFNMIYDIPLLGLGYWIVFIVWGVTGIFVGIISRDILKSLIIDGIAIGVNIIIYSISVSISFPYFPSTFVNNLIIRGYLWNGLVSGLLIPFNLLIQITIESFALPMIVLFTLIGGLINPRPEIYSLFDAKRTQKEKIKYNGNSKLKGQTS